MDRIFMNMKDLNKRSLEVVVTENSVQEKFWKKKKRKRFHYIRIKYNFIPEVLKIKHYSDT